MRRLLWVLLAAVIVGGIAALSHLYQRSMPDIADEDADTAALDTRGLIGRERPDFTLTGLDGQPHRASDWDGRVTVVNFWATWCAPCRREIPALAEVQRRFGDQGVQVVGIALDDRQAVEAFLSDLGVTVPYPLLVEGEDAGIEVAKRYGDEVGVLPFTVMISRERRISFVQLGELTFAQAERTLRGLL